MLHVDPRYISRLMQFMNSSFQLAALQISFLCQMPTENDIKQNLTAPPDTLTLAYDGIYNGILAQKGSAPRIALNAFQWIQCSKEPLSSQTLLDAVTVEVDSSGIFSQNRPAKVKQLLTVCQNLVILDEKLNTFRFAHLSVDEYLETRLPKHDSHLELSKVCFSLLCTHSAWNAYDQNIRGQEGVYEDRHLLLYSVVFWPWHFAHCGEFNRCPTLSSLWDKLISESTYERWHHYYRECIVFSGWWKEDFWRRQRVVRWSHCGRLFWVCVFGLHRVFSSDFEYEEDVNTSEIKNSLAYASKFGELEIVGLLIDNGASVSSPSDRGNCK